MERHALQFTLHGCDLFRRAASTGDLRLVRQVVSGARGAVDDLRVYDSHHGGHVDASRPLRFFTRGLGTKETRSNDMLSLVMFQTDYVQKLIELGESDALARCHEIEQFLRR